MQRDQESIRISARRKKKLLKKRENVRERVRHETKTQKNGKLLASALNRMTDSGTKWSAQIVWVGLCKIMNKTCSINMLCKWFLEILASPHTHTHTTPAMAHKY